MEDLDWATDDHQRTRSLAPRIAGYRTTAPIAPSHRRLHRCVALSPQYQPDVAGFLAFLTTTARVPRIHGLEVAQTVADLLAFAIHSQQRYQTSQQAAAQHAQRAAQLGILRTISQVILGQLELPVTLQAIAEQLQSGLGYAGFHVWLTSPCGHLEEAHVLVVTSAGGRTSAHRRL